MHRGSRSCSWRPVLYAQSNPIAEAVESFQKGDLAKAEATLRGVFRTQPGDPDALGVLAVVLDKEQKYAEAGEAYRRALARTPHSSALLNNYGNHLISSGKADAAREIFRKAIATDPHNANARLQLARMALDRKTPGEALQHLEELPPGA